MPHTNKLNIVLGEYTTSKVIASELTKSTANHDSPNKNIFWPTNLETDKLTDFVIASKTLKVNGFVVTNPHKQSIIECLDDVDAAAMRIDAVNIVVNHSGSMRGFNTDWMGVLCCLAKLHGVEVKKMSHVPKFLSEKTVAIFGAGAMARAAMYASLKAGANVVVFNRTLKNAAVMCDDMMVYFGEQVIHYLDWKQTAKAEACEIIINCTPLGLEPKTSMTPIDSKCLHPAHIVFETGYQDTDTRLISEARTAGCKVITGRDLFDCQVGFQLELLG